ncbi:thioredoxin family protein [candidate division KSB1 bacterium]|nr:thioredoxin family protein [candidate division KSB1 bacterium]
MKKVILLPGSILLFFVLFLNCAKQYTEKSVTPNEIFNPDANVKLAIQQAIQKAELENKNILLMFGANWCPWCHRLYTLFNQNDSVKTALDSNYILVLVDLGRRNKNMDIDSLYGQPNKLGFPALVVLNKTGQQIHTQETGALELTGENVKGHDSQKVIAFLRKWRPTEL